MMRRLVLLGVSLCLLGSSVQARAFAGTLQKDGQRLATYRNLSLAGLGLGMTAMAGLLDHEINGSIERSSLLKHTSDLTNVYGDSRFNLSVSLGLWLGGKATGLPRVEALGSNLLRALVFTQAVVGPIKLAVGRERPDGADKRSFPSGHTANSFAIGRVLHRQYGLAAGLPMYMVGGLVGAGRIEDRHHYLSDVVMGAVVGTIVGNSVTLKHGKHMTLEPTVIDGVTLLVAVMRW